MGSKSSEKIARDKDNVQNQEIILKDTNFDGRRKMKKLEKACNDFDVEDNLKNKKKKHEKDCTDVDVVDIVKCPEEELSKVDDALVEHKKKKKKRKIREVDGRVVTVGNVSYGDENGIGSFDENINGEVELKKEKKRKKSSNVGSKAQLSESMVNDNHVELVKKRVNCQNKSNLDNGGVEDDRESENGSRMDGKKRKRGEDGGDEVGLKKKSSRLDDRGRTFPAEEQKKKKNSNCEIEKTFESTDPLENSAPKKKSRTVSFSDNVEIFPSQNMGTTASSSKRRRRKKIEEDGLVQGKRFSEKEDKMVREAVTNYIINHNLDDEKEGIEKLIHIRKHPELRNCWREIGAALPWRPYKAVYYRANILYQRSETRTWTKEELEEVREFHKKHGADWKTLAEKLGKNRYHVKDTWRRIKLANQKQRHWSQDEYQNLFDLVNKDLLARASAEKKTKYGMLRDNISWTAVSETLETRTDAVCCIKWYSQVTSPMVAQGERLDSDDYNLLIALYEFDACCMEDVNWDRLLEHRSGDVCRKRWNEMVKHLGEHGNKSFADQVDVLYNRYCPDVLEAREIYDSKTPVDE